MRHLAPRVAVALVLALAAGCGAESQPGGQASGEEDSSSSSGDARHGPAGPADDVSPRDGLTDERLVQWSRPRAVGSQGVRVDVTLGTEDCYGVRTVVDEDETRVALATLEGVLPGAPSQCTADAVLATVLVPLDAPLGDRRIVRLPASEVDLR